MKMAPEQSLCQLLSLLSLFSAVHLGTSLSDQAENTHNATDLADVTMPASKPNWKSTTATSVVRRSNQSVSAATKMSPSSAQSSVITTTVSQGYKQNGTLTTTSSWNTVATTANINADTTSSNPPNDTQGLSDSELPLRPTNSSQITKPTTATTPLVNAAPLPVATARATDPPSTTPTTHRVQLAVTVPPRDKPKLAPTPGATKTLSTTLGIPFKPRHSTQNMTIIFSSLLGVLALVIVLYTLDRCKQKKTQYLHRPLYNNSEETADRFVPADDTLVISGGLYDGPRVYNPTMTTANEDEDFPCDQPPFSSRSTQFQLKLLKDEGENPPSYEASTCQASQRVDQDA